MVGVGTFSSFESALFDEHGNRIAGGERNVKKIFTLYHFMPLHLNIIQNDNMHKFLISYIFRIILIFVIRHNCIN